MHLYKSTYVCIYAYLHIYLLSTLATTTHKKLYLFISSITANKVFGCLKHFAFNCFALSSRFEIYICMYVCPYVCMYNCVCVCIYIDACLYVCDVLFNWCHKRINNLCTKFFHCCATTINLNSNPERISGVRTRALYVYSYVL